MNRREFLEKMREGLKSLTVAVAAGGVVGKALGVLKPDDAHAEASIPPEHAITKPYFGSALHINPKGRVRVGSGDFIKVAFTDEDVAIILSGSETDIQAMLLGKPELAEYHEQIAALEPADALLADVLGDLDMDGDFGDSVIAGENDKQDRARRESAEAKEESAAARAESVAARAESAAARAESAAATKRMQERLEAAMAEQ